MYTGIVENLPGFPSGIQCPELSAMLQQQALEAEASVSPGRVESVVVDRDAFQLTTTEGERREARCVVVCVGSTLGMLGVDGEEQFSGRGVSQCAACDGLLSRGRDVAVVGGGDVAADSALILGDCADSVTLHRGTRLSAQHALQVRLEAPSNVRPLFSTEVARMEGADTLQALVLCNITSGMASCIDVQGVFCLIGLEPTTSFLTCLVDLDVTGHVVTDHWMATTAPGRGWATAAAAVQRFLISSDRGVG